MAIGLLIPAGLEIFCYYFFWYQPARSVCQPLQSGSTQYTIVDDNVEAAPIYRCDGKAGHPIVSLIRIMPCIWNGNYMDGKSTEATDSV